MLPAKGSVQLVSSTSQTCSAVPAAASSFLVAVPARWEVARPRLLSQLQRAVEASRLTVITGPSGSGKTALLTAWAARRQLSADVRRLDRRSLTALATVSEAELRRQLGHAGGRAILICENAGGRDRSAAIDRLLRRTGSELRLVLTLRRPTPADSLRWTWSTLTADDLAMTRAEVADILGRQGIDPDPETLMAIDRTTHGWAYGVRIAVAALRDTRSLPTAMRRAEWTIDDYVRSNVLSTMSPEHRDLLLRTSLVGDVEVGLARAMVEDGEPGLPLDEHGFVEGYADGSFRCHPLLRRTLLRQLRGERTLHRLVATRTAQYFIADGRVDQAVPVAVEAAAWSWAARRLVDSMVVPRWLLVGVPPALRSVTVLQAIGSEEPLLMAAAAISRGWLEAVEPALRRAAEAARPGAADRVSLGLLRLAQAKARGDIETGREQVRQVQAQLGELTLVQRADAPELGPLVQSYRGMFELWAGNTAAARSAFDLGSRPFRPGPGDAGDPLQVASAACLGQRAWLDAVAGELTAAVRRATEVLTARPAHRAETGVVYAQLALVWVQIARVELDEARRRFDSLQSRTDADPGLAAAVWLTGTRLAAAVGDPRIGRATWPFDESVAKTGWFGQQLRLARAEAELISGRPSCALEILQNDERPSADVCELRARAWLQIGDLAAVTATLRDRPVEPVSVLTQVQLELIEARLAHIMGDSATRRALIDRVLRTAGRERLRTPIAWAKEWLHTVVITEPELLRLHGAYLASIPTTTTALAVPNPDQPTHAGSLELSERELEILQRLGSLSTNREIAAELFLSTNTVKTHLKSLYRKLEVARRSEAFRRGRALGLC